MKKQNNLRSIGAAFERKAALYLKEKGYHIVCQNYYCPFGEIDLIAQKKHIYVFVEVKYRQDCQLGHPLEVVSETKQQRMRKCALYFIQHCLKRGEHCYRFDVIGYEGHKRFHVQNAF